MQGGHREGMPALAEKLKGNQQGKCHRQRERPSGKSGEEGSGGGEPVAGILYKSTLRTQEGGKGGIAAGSA